MTSLLYVPRKLYRLWLAKGWEPVEDEVSDKEWAILMSPPGWKEKRRSAKNAIKNKKAGKDDGGSMP